MAWDTAVDEALTGCIIKCFFDVYNTLGWGFLESVYSRAMEIALGEAGMKVQREAPIDVYFRGRKVGHGRIDLLVENHIVLENKCGRTLAPDDAGQLLHYLRASELELGFLLHFGPKPKFQRMISTRNDPRKQLYLR